jgi:hypothetical protein
MSTLQHQMAAINFRTANLIAELKELNKLPVRIREVELSVYRPRRRFEFSC